MHAVKPREPESRAGLCDYFPAEIQGHVDPNSDGTQEIGDIVTKPQAG